MARTGDLGALPEAELLEQLWQGGDELPQTAPVTLAGGERLEAEALRIGYSASEVLTQR